MDVKAEMHKNMSCTCYWLIIYVCCSWELKRLQHRETVQGAQMTVWFMSLHCQYLQHIFVFSLFSKKVQHMHAFSLLLGFCVFEFDFPQSYGWVRSSTMIRRSSNHCLTKLYFSCPTTFIWQLYYRIFLWHFSSIKCMLDVLLLHSNATFTLSLSKMTQNLTKYASSYNSSKISK